MINSNINLDSLEEIMKKVLQSIEVSKKQIYQISEDALTEKENIVAKLNKLREEIEEVIAEVDKLEKNYDKSRRRLITVSKSFKEYSEKDIQLAYEEAYKFQVDLFMKRERELNLKTRRNELQIRLKNIESTVDKAKELIHQMTFVFDYLSNDINRMNEIVESVKLRQMFGLKIIEAQEEERKRVAQDIHDGPAQSMANVVLRTEIAERLMSNQRNDLAIKELQDLKATIRKSLADVKQIIFDLRPMALDDLGLLPTIRKFIPEVAKRENLKVELSLTGKERRLSTVMEVAIFRLIQEILNNVVKHAKAGKIEASIDFAEEYITIKVKDDGIGFHQDEVMKNRNYFGLMGMKERVEMLEGDFEIHSIKNKGTTITFKIPINESEGNI